MSFKNSALILLFLILYSCEEANLFGGIEGTIVCEASEIEISASDNIVIANSVETVLWKGSYTDTSLKINFTKKAGTDGETETFTFVFTKKGDCLQVNRGYKYYYGSYTDVSAVTQMYILEFKIKEWDVDKKITGELVYRDHHDKQVYTLKFWIEFNEDDYEVEDSNYNYFSDCLLNKLPINIDVDKDGIIDYNIIYEEKRDVGNRPQFNSYTIKLISTDVEKNKILALDPGPYPYPIVFEAPFSTEDTNVYLTGVKNTLDVFYEFDAPYQKYNYFLNNNLTYKNILKNNKEDYFLVKMYFGDKKFYGWVKFKFNVLDCEIAVLETYLNPIETKHISIEN
jgi:hypothetical protein